MRELPTHVRWDADELCDRFEQAWRSGHRPELAEFLSQWSGPREDVLFRHLLELELDYRRRAQESIVSEEYSSRFPRYSPIIEEVVAASAGDTQGGKGSDTRPRNPQAVRAVPELLGDYEVLEQLGQGGMGIVYRARQLSLKRIVALKMTRAGELSSEEELKRFRAEAEAAARLQHPGIVPVYEVGECEGRLYFSMRLIEGRSLADLIANDPPPLKMGVKLIEQVARSVAYAHDQGVVHRDLKPANILLDQSGTPFITDFGLAKLVHDDLNLTGTGQVLGTPAYMPPEQARGDIVAIGPKSDVYSLGAVLYRLLAHRVPFQAESLAETLQAVIHNEPIAPSELVAGIPRDLDTICLKCLEKSPSRRFASAEELADELARFLRGEPIRSRPVTRLERAWRWSRRNPWVASLLATTCLTLLVGSLVSTYFGVSAMRSAEAASNAANDARERLQEATTARAKEQQAMRELEKSAYVNEIVLSHREWQDQQAGAARDRLEATNPSLRGWEYDFLKVSYEAFQTRLPPRGTGVRKACFVTNATQVLDVSSREMRVWDIISRKLLWTIDGIEGDVVEVADVPARDAWALTLSDGRLRLVNPRDGSVLEEQVSRFSRVRSASFSRDGRRLLLHSYDSNSLLVVWDLVERREVSRVDCGDIQVQSVALSPDGMHCAVADLERRVGIAKIVEGSTQIGKPIELPTFQILDLQFSRTQPEVFVAGTDCYSVSLDGQSQKLDLDVQGTMKVAHHGDALALVDFERKPRMKSKFFQRSTEAIRGNQGDIHRLRFSDNGRYLMMVGEDHLRRGELILFHAAEFRDRRAMYPSYLYGLSYAIAPDHSLLALSGNTSTAAKTLRLCNTVDGKLFRAVDLDQPLHDVTFSADGRWLSVITRGDSAGYSVGSVLAERGGIQWMPAFADGWVLKSRVSSAGEYLAVSYLNKQDYNSAWLKVWRTRDSTVVHEATVTNPDGFSFTFDNRGRSICYNVGEEIRRVDLISGQVIATLRHDEPNGFRSLVFSPSEQWLVGGGFGVAWMWKLDGSRAPLTLRGHHGWVYHAAFTHDETRLLAGSFDGTLKLWDCDRGQEYLTLDNLGGAMPHISLSRDDRRLVLLGLQGGTVLGIEQWCLSEDTRRLVFPTH